ncbi:thioredoxin family protein [Allorhodopirellula heiligendammensis]|uniref:Thiol-disulfide oxidoreductase ResA n=1 Tax=Allorhodopirellula heiligendammensis TaxID=2714739 RepID=A0A5C6BV36_9BACT|nr:thioredoxin family protein [Allorhodopirellula heiligendammensis]TWU16140.1 Thiol-disulfide oxidoreductase ResA [Allorhodopirellula heiligendammensis]
MVRTASTMMPLGTAAPDFSLPETDGGTVSLSDFKDSKALLVVFLCNHCPYVKHVAEQLKLLSDEYMQHGVGIVGINSNDIDKYPEDNFAAMKAEKAERNYAFPYALDEDQSIAIAYGAACTPDFFLFDAQHQLTYRGQLDGSRPKSGEPVTGVDLRAALDETLAGRTAAIDQKPSIGCNIKWKPGNEPAYFDPTGSANK